MKKTATIAFILGLLTMSAYSEFAVGAEQQVGLRTPGGVFLPETPAVGNSIYFGSGERCVVTAVQLEWVKCESMPQWRNLYNGHAYGVLREK